MKFIVYKKEKNFIDRYDVIFLAFVINSANLRAVVNVMYRVYTFIPVPTRVSLLNHWEIATQVSYYLSF